MLACLAGCSAVMLFVSTTLVPLYPNLTSQLYVQGELVGGLDIIKEMKHDGALAPQLGLKPKVVHITPARTRTSPTHK